MHNHFKIFTTAFFFISYISILLVESHGVQINPHHVDGILESLDPLVAFSQISSSTIRNMEDDLYGTRSDLVTFETLQGGWVPSHYGRVNVVGFMDSSQKYTPLEIMPKEYYEMRAQAIETGNSVVPPAAPLLLEDVQQTLKDILLRDMFYEKRLMNIEIVARPDGLADVGLLFLAEMRLQLNSLRKDNEWKIKIISQDHNNLITQYLGNEEKPIFMERIQKLIEKESLKITNMNLRKEIRSAIKKFGIQFATRVRFGIACPTVMVKKVSGSNGKRRFERSNHYRARVVLVRMIPVVPKQQMYVRDAIDDDNILEVRNRRLNYYGGLSLGITPWRALMLHGERPLRSTTASSGGKNELDRLTTRLIMSFVHSPLSRGSLLKRLSNGDPATSKEFRRLKLNGKPNLQLLAYTVHPLPFPCLQNHIFEVSSERTENLHTYKHCVRLPFHLHHLYPEEIANIYLGLYPYGTEVIYQKLEKYNGKNQWFYYYRQCEDGWTTPHSFGLNSFDKGEKYHQNCMASLNERSGDGFGFEEAEATK